MKVFVTGHKGYIGVHVVDVLKTAGHYVTGCDVGLFDGCAWEQPTPPDRELNKDFRDVTARELDGYDCVMHLAAISNDPMGDLHPDITLEINRDGSVELAERAKRAGIERFLFSGSCSVYGKGVKPDLSEDDPLSPLTVYARSKIETESKISELADDSFSPAFLRNATAYGHSPALRIDLVVNNLLASAVAYGEIQVKSDGTPWRPLVHCRDIARAFLAFMTIPKERIHNRSVNVGANEENHQVSDVAEQVRRLIPSAQIVFTGEVGKDPRDYRVNFDLLGELLPDFRLQYGLANGMEELHRKYVEHGFSANDFIGDRFVRLRTLAKRLNRIGVYA
jgi:nucleoside-diphosphate-sugar epimerase